MSITPHYSLCRSPRRIRGVAETWQKSWARHRLLAIRVALLACSLLVGHVHGQSTGLQPLRIGFVLPLPTGGMPLNAGHQHLAGDAARMGAVLAEELLGAEAEGGGFRLEVLISNAPDAQAAERAGQRMLGLDEAVAVVGGFGGDQAASLARVAEENRKLFFNIGSPASQLREQCRRTTFHIEARDRSYLNALASWYASQDLRRWFLVHAEGEAGEELLARTRSVMNDGHGELTEMGNLAVSDSTAYIDAVQAIRAANADLVVLLLDWRAQLDFMGIYDAFSLNPVLTGIPYPVTQTRDFYRAAADAISGPALGSRASLWEATLEDHGAADLNNSFYQRWGLPMDGPAWAAYAAVRIVVETVLEAQSRSTTDLIALLERPGTSFDLEKGQPLSFQPDDHQLRQPLYLAEIDRSAEAKLGMASLLATFAPEQQTDSVESSDCGF